MQVDGILTVANNISINHSYYQYYYYYYNYSIKYLNYYFILEVNESCYTGNTLPVRKGVADFENTTNVDPFLVSGTQVCEGYG